MTQSGTLSVQLARHAAKLDSLSAAAHLAPLPASVTGRIRAWNKKGMSMIQGDKQDLFAAPDGTPRIRYAISNREGVCCEMSMHDPTIQSLLAPEYWLPVFTALQESAKINRVDGRLVVLLGFGKPRDPIGNLIMMRVSSQPGFSPTRMALVINLILMTLMQFGIRLDKNMEDTIRGN